MKPNLIIIGAQKCGTSSLHHYLDQHPDVSMSETKELDFFVDSLNWKKGLEWYESKFTGNTAIHGESSPSYAMYPNFAGIPERMHSIIPDAKLIYIVRDPIERIVSHYLHQWYGKRQHDKQMAALMDTDNNRTRHYILTSSYHLQLSQYIEFYDYSRILVVTLEELKDSRRETLRKVFHFLELDDNSYPSQADMVFNATQAKIRTNKFGELVQSKSSFINSLRKVAAPMLPTGFKNALRSKMSSKIQPQLTPEMRCALSNALRDDINKFRELTGQSFEKWTV